MSVTHGEAWKKITKILKVSRLGIIIPYRDREAHLAKMLPHTVSYFRRNTSIEPLFVIAEQSDDKPFNRGSLINHGYNICSGMVDYVCFHDVDYMPMWADYSEPSLPSRIIWWGLHERPIGHGSDGYVKAQKEGLAAIAVMRKWHFEAANGFSNGYWGWGYEDTDIAKRLESVGIPLGYRDGTFIPIDHDSNGFDKEGKPSQASQENAQRFESRKYPDLLDGLSSLDADVESVEQMMCKGLADESAPLLWCKFNLSDMYAKR